MQESLWVVSGDGEYLRHALTNEDGYQLARAWVDGKGGVGRWVEGFVNDGAFQTGIFLGCDRHVDYQVLLASQSLHKTSDSEPAACKNPVHVALASAGSQYPRSASKQLAWPEVLCVGPE